MCIATGELGRTRLKDQVMTEIPKAYEPKEIEKKWYPVWESREYFKPDMTSTAPTFSMVIPPPNVTGYLHMGHALNHTLGDVLVRWHRMQGDKTLWLPGTDHAGIATQAVVEKQLVKAGTSRTAFSREEFIQKVWEWKHHSGGTIQKQMRLEGISVDWSRERFTLDDGLSKAVAEVFVRLYNEGLIYRGEYLVNWSPVMGSAISDLEVIMKEVKDHLYHIAYPVKDSDERIVVATTRPETMLGDTAVAMNPTDERYQHLVGKSVVLPLVGREIPLIQDEFVEKEFGTGLVKVTPAHDPNDFEMGKRHKLPFISVIGKDGKISDEAPETYRGLDRFEARKRVVADLEAQGFMVKIEDYTHNVGHSERSGERIEPLMSTQWFLNVKPLAEVALQAVKDGRTRIVPENWTKVYCDWLENIRPWCISRQLWWGHRIPAWYTPEGEIVVAHTEEEAQKIYRDAGGTGTLTQDEDVLDTWFSSQLWPFSTMGWPEQTEDLKAFYPTSVLITAFDIIFFWVARMMMIGLKLMDDVPFRTVYITPLVRTAEGQKMSKSVGNVIDPLDIFDKYGTDAVRYTLAAATTWGSDIALQDSKMEAARNFANKIWNATRFVLMNCEDVTEGDWIDSSTTPASLADKWILSRLNYAIKDFNSSLGSFRYHDAANRLYHFFWDDFCDWYIELSKPLVTAKEASSASDAARKRIIYVLEHALRLLHPIMPYITEELWQRIPHHGESIAIAPFPSVDESQIRPEIESDMDSIIEIIKRIRNIRAEWNIAPSQTVRALIGTRDSHVRSLIESNNSYLERIAKLDGIEIHETLPPMSAAARAVIGEIEIAVPLEGIIDFAKERERVKRDIEKTEKELTGLQGRLNNPSFVDRAAPEVVEQTRERAAEFTGQLTKLKETLGQL